MAGAVWRGESVTLPCAHAHPSLDAPQRDSRPCGCAVAQRDNVHACKTEPFGCLRGGLSSLMAAGTCWSFRSPFWPHPCAPSSACPIPQMLRLHFSYHY